MKKLFLYPVFRVRFTVLLRVCLLLFCLGMFSACFSVENNDRTLDELYRHMAKETNCTYFCPMEPGPVHADGGFSVMLAGRQVAFYKYDKTKVRKQLKKLQYVEKNGFIYIAGVKLPAVARGSFIMVDYEENKEKEALLKAFRSF